MTETINRGPFIGLGSLEGGVTTSTGTPVDVIQPYDGPELQYQGSGWLDPRFYPAQKDSLTVGRFPAFKNSSNVILVNALPSASSATPVDIAALQATTNGTAMTLVTVQPSAAVNGQCAHMPSAPLIPFGGSSVIRVFGLDMGMAYGTTTAGSGTVTLLDSSIYQIGQFLVVGGAGNSGGTLPLITQVTAVPTATTITVSPAAVGAITRAPLSSANAYIGFPTNVTATAVQPYLSGGAGRYYNSAEGVTRVVGINAAAGAAGGIFTVRGYDIYGYPMSEAITVGAGAAVAYGNKCFKYIVSITPNVTDAVAHYSAGVGDTIGLNIRSGSWELLTPFVAQALLTVATGWNAGLATSSGPSTATTADVRGSIQVGTRGNNTGIGSAGAAGGPFSGTVRIAVRKSVSINAMLGSTPLNSNLLFGLPQFTN